MSLVKSEYPQFALEESIFSCWYIIDDLHIAADATTDEETRTILYGMAKLYDIKFNKCFNNFEELLRSYYEYKSTFRSNRME
jgi:hypothetical protein